MVSSIGGSGDTLNRVEEYLTERRDKAAGRARVAASSDRHAQGRAAWRPSSRRSPTPALTEFAAAYGLEVPAAGEAGRGRGRPPPRREGDGAARSRSRRPHRKDGEVGRRTAGSEENGEADGRAAEGRPDRAREAGPVPLRAGVHRRRRVVLPRPPRPGGANGGKQVNLDDFKKVEAPDTKGITTVSEYKYVPGEKLPPVKGVSAYKWDADAEGRELPDQRLDRLAADRRRQPRLLAEHRQRSSPRSTASRST